MEFEEFNLSGSLLAEIKKLGHKEPTQVQSSCIPPIIEGKDLIGESETGSGKTLAFGCGIVEHVKPGQGLQALVLTPTRELAEQVKNYLKQLSSLLRIITIYGGVSLDPQMKELRHSEVVVGTPGRLLDHLQRRTIDLSKVRILVLDEADRMLDMGFMDDVERIIRACPKQRQTLFFSATISDRIRDLGKKYMNQPVHISAGKYVDPSKLKQVYFDVFGNMKVSLLVHLLQSERSGLVMVFCNSRNTTNFVLKNLRSSRVKAIGIHGGFTQNKRNNTIELFNEGKVHVLVCTDVAARGLHINNVSHIYNYDIPRDSVDYVHRIGRTARAGKDGIVINLLSDRDHDNFSRILRDYSTFTIEKVKTPYVQKMMVRQDVPETRGKFQHHRRN